MIHPRLYQSKGVHDIRITNKSGHKQIIWSCATGGGKTIVGADITHRAIQKGNHVLWLVHREEILNQTVKKLVLFGENPGIIQGNDHMKNSAVHVAMVQTLSRRLDFFKKNKLLSPIVISDECHHGCAPQWLMIFQAIKEIYPQALIIGQTATPIRGDNIGLSSAGYTSLIQGPQYMDLLNPDYDGKVYLSEPVVFYSPLTFRLSKAKSKKRNKDFDPTTEEQIFGEKIVINNCIDLYNDFFAGAPAIIFGASVNDCLNVTAAMRATGWSGGTVYDGMDSEERRDYLDGLSTGKYNFLCSYDILGEGVDIGLVAGCIKRRRTYSLGIEMQQNGRGSRQYPGKKYNIIVDQCGNSLIHGHPLTRREWNLEGIIKTKVEKEIKMIVCQFCGAMLQGNPSNCPFCGERLKQESFSDETIKEIHAPMEILPAPAFTGAKEEAEIKEFHPEYQESEIVNRISTGNLSSYGRLSELAKMIGKDDKWTSLVWRKYHAGN